MLVSARAVGKQQRFSRHSRFVLLCHAQEGSTEDDLLGAIAMGENGSVVMGGFSAGDWDGHSGGADFAAVKLDSDGIVQWRWQV